MSTRGVTTAKNARGRCRYRAKPRIQAAGWRIGDAQDFLRLTEQELMLLQIKESLSQAVRTTRTRQKLTQAELAKRMHSSQARVARI